MPIRKIWKKNAKSHSETWKVRRRVCDSREWAYFTYRVFECLTALFEKLYEPGYYHCVCKRSYVRTRVSIIRKHLCSNVILKTRADQRWRNKIGFQPLGVKGVTVNRLGIDHTRAPHMNGKCRTSSMPIVRCVYCSQYPFWTSSQGPETNFALQKTRTKQLVRFFPKQIN